MLRQGDPEPSTGYHQPKTCRLCCCHPKFIADEISPVKYKGAAHLMYSDNVGIGGDQANNRPGGEGGGDALAQQHDRADLLLVGCVWPVSVRAYCTNQVGFNQFPAYILNIQYEK